MHIFRDQVVLRRFADGRGQPSESLIGDGPQYVLRATAKTRLATPPALVVTEDVMAPTMSQWQGGTYNQPDYAQAVLGTVVRDLTLAGHDDKDWRGAGDVNHNPHQWNIGTPDQYSLLILRANGALVENVQFFFCPGVACVIARDVNPNLGNALEYDREVNVAHNLCFSRVFSGLHLKLVDGMADTIEVRAFRDYGIRMWSGCQATALHPYGGSGPGVWLESTCNQLSNSYSEHADTGVRCTGAHNLVSNMHYKQNRVTDVVSTDAGNRFSLAWHEGSRLGYLISGPRNSVSEATIELIPNATGIRLTNGMEQVVRDVVVHGDGGTGLASEAALNGCTIDMSVTGCKVGVDLFTGGVSRLGMGNLIRLRTNVATPVNLPPVWDRKSNRITVNGVEI